MFGKPVIIDGKYAGWAFSEYGAAKKAAEYNKYVAKGPPRSAGELNSNVGGHKLSNKNDGEYSFKS